MLLRRKKFIFSLIAFLILVVYQRFAPAEEVLSEKVVVSPTIVIEQTVKQSAQVVRVIDGDTIEVLLNDKKEKIRVIGINAPETVNPVECFGKEATSFAKEILENQAVVLESDVSQQDKDKYDRLLRYVYINNVDFGKFMIEQGYAYEYTYDKAYKFQSEYIDAQRRSETEEFGLWKDKSCVK